MQSRIQQQQQQQQRASGAIVTPSAREHARASQPEVARAAAFLTGGNSTVATHKTIEKLKQHRHDTGVEEFGGDIEEEEDDDDDELKLNGLVRAAPEAEPFV